jgi:hypothetical protein
MGEKQNQYLKLDLGGEENGEG